jgi:putative inorganic carbon (HCO3(-)) transporter
VAEVAASVGALGAALIVLADSRAPLLGGLGLVSAALVGLAAAGGEADAAATLLDSVAGLGALVAGAVALVGGAAALVRWPAATTPALLAVAPIRLPIVSDPDSAVLLGLAGTGAQGRLYPLYAVLAAAALALTWRIAQGAPVHPIPRPLALPAAAFLALVVVSLLWSQDQPAAEKDLLFVWIPFCVLLVVAAQAPVTARTPRALALTLVGVAGAFAAVGIWQAFSEQLFFFNVALERANELGPIFRVTSAFQDPNHLGRHLVLAIVVVLVAVWLVRLSLPLAIALLALLGGALWLTYSQSSLVALAAVALAVMLVAGDRGARRAAGAVSIILVLGGSAALAVGLSGGSAADFTSDRSTLVFDTAAVAASHPLAGVGVAAQPLVTRDQEAPRTSKLQNASHTTPLTVAAETGVLGVLAFLALLAGAVRVLISLARRDAALALGLAAVLAVLLLHSLFYAGLFENPITWGTLGVAAAAMSQGPRAAASWKPRMALRS